MNKRILWMLVLGIMILSLLSPLQAENPLLVVTSTEPERADPLIEMELTIELTNTTDEMMWNPVISLDISNDPNNFFTLIDEEVTIDMGDKEFIAINESVTTTYRIMANANCPAQKHVIPVLVRYRSGACEGGCQNDEIMGSVIVQIFREDPKVAVSLEGPTEIFPGDPLIIVTELKNFGTGSALNINITASSEPLIEDLKTTILSEDDPVRLDVTGTVLAMTETNSMSLSPGFYTFYIDLVYGDKYGNTMFNESTWEIKVIGTPSQEALFQANQLKDLGVNAYQLKNYNAAISYLERAIDIYERLDEQEDITVCQDFIYLATTYIQANNYFEKGDHFFELNDFHKAKDYYTLAYESYKQLGNNNKVTESRKRINTCDEELNKYDTMNYGAIGAALLCAAYGVFVKRKRIIENLKK